MDAAISSMRSVVDKVQHSFGAMIYEERSATGVLHLSVFSGQSVGRCDGCARLVWHWTRLDLNYHETHKFCDYNADLFCSSDQVHQ
jgi:hypothetical protein